MPPPRPRDSSRGKRLEFGGVDIIPNKGTARKEKAQDVPRMYELRRSPTPLLGLDNLAQLTTEHLAQLNAVWKEKDLPAFDVDSRRIAETFQGRDPFD